MNVSFQGSSRTAFADPRTRAGSGDRRPQSPRELPDPDPKRCSIVPQTGHPRVVLKVRTVDMGLNCQALDATAFFVMQTSVEVLRICLPRVIRIRLFPDVADERRPDDSMSTGATNSLSAAPELPALKMPIARP